eukprot:2798864-Amphidinium_carterae.1
MMVLGRMPIIPTCERGMKAKTQRGNGTHGAYSSRSQISRQTKPQICLTNTVIDSGTLVTS